MKKDFLSMTDFSAEEIRETIARAFAFKKDPGLCSTALKGKALAMLFEKPSLRTRVTFDVAVHQLGGYSVVLNPGEINLGRRESIDDVARNLERMVQGILVRTFGHEIVVRLAEHARIPVINGLTDFCHPCQALADYMTIIEVKGTLHGLKVAYVGDGNNVAHSLIHGAARLAAQLSVATPPGHEPDASVMDWARSKNGDGCRIELTGDPAEAVTGADVVYTDVWASMGQEDEARERRRTFRPYQVDGELFARAKKDAVFMHCLPAHRGEEVTPEVIDSPRSVVFQQAENRLYVQKALLLNLMS